MIEPGELDTFDMWQDPLQGVKGNSHESITQSFDRTDIPFKLHGLNGKSRANSPLGGDNVRKITEFHVNTLAMRAILDQLQIAGVELPNKNTVCYYGYNDELEYNKFGLLVPASAMRGAVVSGRLTIPFSTIVGVFEYEVEAGASQRPIGFETNQ